MSAYLLVWLSARLSGKLFFPDFYSLMSIILIYLSIYLSIFFFDIYLSIKDPFMC